MSNNSQPALRCRAHRRHIARRLARPEDWKEAQEAMWYASLLNIRRGIEFTLLQGKCDRIDLCMFYPFLAVLAEGSHMSKWKPQHPALSTLY